MVRRSLLFGSVILIAMSSVAMADLIDPRMIIDAGDPDPIIITSLVVNDVAPDNIHDPLDFDFINGLDGIITGFTFNTMVAPGLDPAAFTCESGYFLHCTALYTPGTGDLSFSFFGVNPADGDEDFSMFPFATEAGEQEGIPLHGAFHIRLVGFTNGSTPGLFDDTHQPTAFAGTLTATPEPSAIFVLLASFGLMAAAMEFRRRRRAVR